MRLKRYINEARSIDEIYEILSRDCKPFINEFLKKKKTFIWRGTNKRVDFIQKITPRKDRKPRDMPKELHKFLDNVFKDNFGWYVRSEGVFASSDRSFAEDFSDTGGDSYLFFPIGRYDYIWSPVIKDIYTWLGRSQMYIEYYHNDDKIKSSWFISEDMFEAQEVITIPVTKALDAGDANRIVFTMNLDHTGESVVLYEWERTNPDASLSSMVATILTGVIDGYKDYIRKSISKYYSDKNFQKKRGKDQELAFKCKEYYLVGIFPHEFEDRFGARL